MKLNRKIVITGASVLALAAGGAGTGVAIGGGKDAGEHATGSGAHKAKKAALQLLPGGHTNAVERDGENGATWEVEVTRPDGSTVDVRLDAALDVVVTEGDVEHANGR